MLFTHLAEGLCAVPFLPQGKGALILILGGLALLPVSLLLSRTSRGAQRWIAGLDAGARLLGLGALQVVTANVHTCIVIVTACATCRAGHATRTPCVREQRALERAARTYAPEADVVEISCNRSGRGSCTFIIHRGGSP